VLPVVAFGEEQVTFTSTDRRIQLAKKVSEPPEGTIPAWRQLMMAARALGADWRYLSSADVMDEIAEVVPFYGGVSHDNLARDYGRQWPCTKDRPLGTRDLFEGALPERGFRLAPLSPPEVAVNGAARFPMTLIFGQSLYYWHQNVLVKHSETLKREHRLLLLDYPEGFVEINPEDARGLEIRDGERIRLISEQGEAGTFARVSPEVRAGTVYVPFFLREVERAMWGRERFGLGSLSEPVFVRVEKA
jgi:formate dehydrogenase alpha subunit